MSAMIPATAFVASASIAWGMHARGNRRIGNLMLALCLAGLWALSVIRTDAAAVKVSPEIARRTSGVHASEISKPARSATQLGKR